MNNNAEVGKLASWQVGNARILNSNYYNSLIINDSNILEEKTRGLPSCQLANFLCSKDEKSLLVLISCSPQANHYYIV